MSADVLTRAASRLRELVLWCTADGDVPEWYGADDMAAILHASEPNHSRIVHDAAYIAAMSPDVALALADWLEGVALLVAAREDEEWHDLDGDPIAPEDTHAIGSALRVARAVLREDT